MPAPIRRVDELGFPLPGSFDELTDQPSRPKRSWGKFFYKYRWGVLLLLLPILFGSTVVTGARQAVAHWLLTKAEIHYQRDQMRAALASTNRALFWEPDAFDCWQEYSIRANIFVEMQDHLKDSLDDLNEVIKRLDDPARSQQFADNLCDAYGRRAWVFERLGRHREAIADATTALNIATDRSRANLFNQRAYIRALDGTELDQALQDVQQSLSLQPEDPEIVVDTRGYILFRQGKYTAALQDIDQALRGEMSPQRRFMFQGDDGPRLQDGEFQSLNGRKYKEGLAVMLHHRGEIRQKIAGQEAKGSEDIRRAEAMGYDRERGVY